MSLNVCPALALILRTLTTHFLNVTLSDTHKIHLFCPKTHTHTHTQANKHTHTHTLCPPPQPCLTSTSTRTLPMRMKVMLKASSSSSDSARQPFSLHSSTAWLGQRSRRGQRSTWSSRRHYPEATTGQP